MATQRHDDSFKINQFGGMLPAWDPLLLPEGQAANSINGYLFSGALQSWRVPKLLKQFSDNPGYVYRLPAQMAARATATLLFNANPAAGKTVTIGEETYTFTATVTAAYNVLIGATPSATATNFFTAITGDNGTFANQGTLYGNGTIPNPAIDQTSPQTKNTLATGANPRVTVVAPDNGAAYNTTTVLSTDANLAWVTGAGQPTVVLTGGTNSAIDTSITSQSTWMEFADPNTDVVRSPVVDDKFDRYYMASSSLAPMYNTRARIESALPAWLLGVPAPGCSPGVAVAGGGNSATIGFPTSTSGAQGTPGANTIYLIPITPTGAQILNDVAIVCQTTSASARFAAVLYNDVGGSPHSLLNTGVVMTGTTAGGTLSSAFTNPTGLLANVQYWIGIMSDTALAFQLADNTGSKGVVSLNTFSNGPPATIQNLSTGYSDLQMWGDLTTSSVLEARSYVYTYITEYGEESPPSPATVLTGWSNGIWTISLFQPPADQIGANAGAVRDIKWLRIYRTITATSGSTTYYQLTGTTPGTDLPVTTATYVDTITDATLVANNQLQSQLWSPPPAGLQGLVVLPNGMLAGWKTNEIWFCEPYRPHAWPPSYVLTTEYPIVGLGVTGNTLVAATTGAPYAATGTTPGTMTALKIQNSEPCHSRKSVLGSSDGVYYTSRNGLIKVTQYGQVINTTETWITREQWQALTPQSNVAAVFLVGQYFAWQWGANNNENGLGQRGFSIELSAEDADSFTIWPQPGRHRRGFQLLTNALATPINMVEIDPWSAVCLVVSRQAVYQYDFTDQAPTLSVVDWTSKKYQQRTKKNFEAMRIKFDLPSNAPVLNSKRLTNLPTDPIWTGPLPADRYGFILVYAADQLITAREIRVNQEVLRIESGSKHETWQFRIIARVPIKVVQVGTTVKGMANV